MLLCCRCLANTVPPRRLSLYPTNSKLERQHSKHSCQGPRLPVNKARLLPNRIICILGRSFFPFRTA